MVLLLMVLHSTTLSKSFLTVPRVMGDPIFSMWSLLWKLKANHLCLQAGRVVVQSLDQQRLGTLAAPHSKRTLWGATRTRKDVLAQELGVIIRAMTDLLRGSKLHRPDDAELEDVTACLHHFISKSRTPFTDLLDTISSTASSIVKLRTQAMWKAWAAVVVCVVELAVLFIPAINDSKPSGSKIAATFLLSWLIPLVLLGETVGGYSDFDLVRKEVLRFFEGHYLDPEALQTINALKGHHRPLAWTGGLIYYQPTMTFSPTLLILACLPVLYAVLTTGFALGSPPTYFNERHFLLIGLSISWFLSAVTTWLLSQPVGSPPKISYKRFLVISVKDIILSLASPALLSVLTCGWLSTCESWSGHYWFRGAAAAVQLNPWLLFESNHRLFRNLILASLFFGLLYYLASFYWRTWIHWVLVRLPWAKNAGGSDIERTSPAVDRSSIELIATSSERRGVLAIQSMSWPR